MKSKFNNSKRGFTIVELVIVIAIIAILAAVLIPTFSSLVQSAQMASDTSLITNLNKELAMAEAKDGKNATMSDVIKDLEDAGYSLALITPTAEGCYIAWDADTDRVVYMDSEFKILYPKENKGETLANAWQIAHNKEQLEKYVASGKTFNVYLASGFDATELVVSYGIDVGDNTGITKLSYVNTSGSAKNVVIRTNGGKLEINAPLDTVHHYNTVNNVVITAVASESYHENGVVLGNISVAQGRVEVAESAKVGTVLVTGNGVKIDTKNDNLKIVVLENVETKPNVNGKEFTDEGESKAVLVSNFDDLKKAIYSGATAVLTANITTSNKIFLKDSTMKNGARSGAINLNGYSLTYTSTSTNATQKYFIAITDELQLTIEGTGKIETTKAASIFSVRNAKLIINDGEFASKANDPSSSLIAVDASENGTIVINNGKFTAKEACIGMFKNANLEINGGEFTSMDNFVIGTNGSAEYGNNNITINDGTFNGNIETDKYIACGIYLANKDTLVVNGGTFNIVGGVGILIRGGKATINNVTINLDNNGPVSGKIGDSREVVFSSRSIVVDKYSDYTDCNNIEVNTKYKVYTPDGTEYKAN